MPLVPMAGAGSRYYEAAGGESPASGDSNFNFTTQEITGTPAILDLRQDYSVDPRDNVLWLGGVERLATYEYVGGGGYYGEGCARFVPGRNVSDPIGNPNGDHPGGIGQLYFPTDPQIVTVGILWRHGSTLLSESNGVKSLILLRGGGQSTRPMIIAKGDWNTTGPGGGTVVLPPCDGTICNASETALPEGEENYFNDPAVTLPDISAPWAQWIWTEASIDLTQTPSIMHVRSWFADESELGTHVLRKNLYEGAGGTIPGIDIVGYYNSIDSPTENAFLEIERVEVHVGEFGPITPPVGFPGSTR